MDVDGLADSAGVFLPRHGSTSTPVLSGVLTARVSGFVSAVGQLRVRLPRSRARLIRLWPTARASDTVMSYS